MLLWTCDCWFLGLKNQIVYDMTQGLMEKLAAEAFEVAMVSSRDLVLSFWCRLSLYSSNSSVSRFR